MQNRINITVAALFLAFALLGCDRATDLSGREDFYRKLAIEKPETVTKAPDFTLEDPTGKKIGLSHFSGKVVFLNFWATWCPPCVQEMPTMERLHREFANDGLVVLAVNYQEKPDQVRDFFSQHKLTFTALLDRHGKVSERYEVWGLPVTVIINKRGEIAGKVAGARDWHSDQAQEFFRQLLAEKP